ncbi:MAG: UDP-3-O-(3-hydroxymyristoyl)glucosamine N-acyltransferase [Rickettsiales bacterium]|nr:UDP-3-O-(3-hydroxymyristoyl)glucosamine N-acyltransferase [Rickettsiales bacterium]
MSKKKDFALTIRELSDLLSGEVVGDDNELITTISEIQHAEKGSITFLSNPRYTKHLESTRASVLLLDSSFDHLAIPGRLTLIKVDNAYLSFTALLETYQKLTRTSKIGLDEPHFIGDHAKVGEGCYIGAFSYLGNEVQIGDHVKIYPQCHIGDGVTIGDHTILYPGVKIYNNSKIGSFCNIQAGAVIGSHGFGFAPQKDGSYQNIPQIGNVELGNHVDIGANTTIDCATIGTTRIADGVKIDNLVQVAHNVEIGQHTAIAAQTGISGSVKIGKHVLIGGQTGTVGHIEIADFTKIGARSGITKNTKSDQVLWGVPAIDRQEYLKAFAIYRKLPELQKKIEELEGKILNLMSDK